MTQVTQDTAGPVSRVEGPRASTAPPSTLPGSHGVPRWQRIPALPLALTLVLFAFVFFPPVRDNPRLVWTFSGVSGALFLWELLLWGLAVRRGTALPVEFFAVKSHYVQAAVQFAIIVWWGWYAREVYAFFPLILAQVVFLYAFEGLVTWSRGRTWRLGFGPMPIILSTNLLLWFKEDWFIFQFLMLAIGALGKQFVTWTREGRRTHIFNPSAFGQFLFAVVLIATGTTSQLTWGERIAATFDPPHMLLVIFLGGLVVQYLFHVTLMTLAAAAMICLLNLAHTEVTGVYFFINTNFAAPIFLGLHLLVTDPATSPRTNLGRVVFGGLYGLAYFALFRLLENAGVPTFWDKLLPVPFLNLCVPLIDRLSRAGIPGHVNRLWETALRPARLNLVHMVGWAGLFGTMAATGYIESRHPGNSIPFWKVAVAEGKPRADRGLLIAAGSQAERGSGDALNELGVAWIEGKTPWGEPSPPKAARYFSLACEAGSMSGCVNVADQFLFYGGMRSKGDVERALERLERECGTYHDSNICFRLGYAYETGRGRPLDRARAIALYEKGGRFNLYAGKGLARIALSENSAPYDLTDVAPLLLQAAAGGDDESCWYLAYMHQVGNGVPQDPQRARSFLARACALGSAKACDAVKQPDLPPFSRPVLLVPPWSTAFPLPPALLARQNAR